MAREQSRHDGATEELQNASIDKQTPAVKAPLAVLDTDVIPIKPCYTMLPVFIKCLLEARQYD